MKYTILAILLIPMLLIGQTDHWRIIWRANPPSDNVSNYLGFRDTHPNATTQRFSTADTSYIDTNLQPGVIYYYRLKAVNAYGESDYSIEVHESIPDALSIPNQIVSFGSSFNQIVLPNYVNEPDGDAVTWSFESTDNAVSISPSGNITYTPGWYGTVNIIATVSDGLFDDFTSFNLTVNAPPIPTEVDTIWFEKVD